MEFFPWTKILRYFSVFIAGISWDMGISVHVYEDLLPRSFSIRPIRIVERNACPFSVRNVVWAVLMSRGFYL